jgi:ubiquitin-conjugating enzyme E2 M
MIGYQTAQKKTQNTKATTNVTLDTKGKKTQQSGYQIRVKKDLEELEEKWKDCLKVEDGALLSHFTLTLKPDEGIWKGHPHIFDIVITKDYPIKPPKIMSKTLLYHPNIDPEGHICLNILREDWKPVLNLNAIFTGLHFLFLEPNPTDPLDTEAADVYQKDYNKFVKIAKNYINGNKSKYV